MSILGDKQNQIVADGSTAIQAAGDVHYHGLSVMEVRELCILFLRENFPILRKEALEIAEQNVKNFISQLESRLVKDAASIVLDKFRDPDVQATINDAVQASARKGSAAHPLLLSTLISQRISSGSIDYKDVVISEAVKVVAKLTSPQISLISFIHFVRSMKIRSSTVQSLEPYGFLAHLFSSPGFNLSDSQKRHLQYAGTCSINNLVGGDIYEAVREGNYHHFGLSEHSFKAAIKENAPSLETLFNQFNKEKLMTCQLTSVGEAIALANISNYIEGLDYSIWLN